MKEEIHQILSALNSQDIEAQNAAALQIAMLLEKHSPLRAEQHFYDSFLPTPLNMLVLSEEDKKELIESLYQLVLCQENNASMIWALGKAASVSALEHLLLLVCEQKKSLSDNALWQAFIAIDNFLSITQESPIYLQVRQLLHSYPIAQVLSQIGNDKQDKLIQLAQEMLKALTSH